MAKEPETRDRFRIFAETTSEGMGPLLAQLAKIGLQNIGYELITDVTTFKSKARHQISHTDHAMAWLKDHPTFRAIDLVEHFRADGRSKNSGYGTLKRLVEKKAIRKLSEGNYQRFDVKAITSSQQRQKPARKTKPAKAAKQKRTRAPVARYETTNVSLLLNAIKNRKRFTVKEMEQLLSDAGRNQASASPLIHGLQRDKVIKQIEPGVYAVNKVAAVKATAATAAKKSASQRAAMNGAHPAP